MALNKKIVMLPYDFDTAIGIDNYGRLRFSYELEDIDTVNDEKVYAGQDSVLWKNVRAAFDAELTAMYKNLRSGNNPVLSYDNVKTMFEDHQNKWSEALFNEDSWYKYILPLIENNENRLEMCLGSKAEQRKWWLYNRFKYIDSKYNAGDAAADSVSLRTYYEPTQGETYGITITPYADIYATVMYGVAKGQLRAPRNQAILIPCSLSHLEFTDTYIYSASQIKSFGDLSIFKPDAVEFSKATHIQELKLGDSSSNYENPNLKALSLGNNVLLKKVDCRNCINMGTGAQKTVDLSGCSNIEEVYFDGTAIQGLTLPNGGFLKKLHLPDTITNLTLLNQKNITEFVCSDFSNVSTLRLENIPNNIIDTKSIINDISTGCRVRLIGFYWTAEDAEEISDLLDVLDTMRGLDEQGNTITIENGGCSTTISGEIHTSSLTGAEIAEFNQKYPYLRVTANHISCKVRFLNADGSLMYEETVLDGADATYNGTPSKPSTAQYTFTFAGWSKEDDNTVDADAKQHIIMDRTLYPCYTNNLRYYTATFIRASEDGGGTLYTQRNIPYGTIPTYGGTTPTTTKGNAETWPFDGWTPALGPIVANTTYTAKFRDTSSPTRKLIERTIMNAEYSTTSSIGDYAFFSCPSLKTASFPSVTTISDYALYNCPLLTTANFSNATCIGDYAFYYCYNLTTISFPNVTTIGSNAFGNCSKLTTVSFPNATYIGNSAFNNCYNLTSVSFSNVTSIGGDAFFYCSSLTTASFPKVTSIAAETFYACPKLTTISFPNVTSIGSSAFYYCNTLSTVSFPNATYIGSSAFQNCYSLTSISFPNVDTIGSNAFSNCSNLISVSFPNVHLIHNSAFASCYNLTTAIFLSSSVVYITGSNVFKGTSPALSIYVPASLVANYKTANGWTDFSSRIVAYGGE